jgi:hypothetical protein
MFKECGPADDVQALLYSMIEVYVGDLVKWTAFIHLIYSDLSPGI